MRAQLGEQPVAPERAAFDGAGADVVRARIREGAGVRMIRENQR